MSAKGLNVSVASVVRWLKSPVPKATRNKKATKIDRAALARDVRDNPDAFQYERVARFGVSQRGIGEALHRLGVTYKKTLSPPKASKDGRRAFRARIKAHEAASRAIVSINESGFANDIPYTHGYAAKGKRCFGRHAWGRAVAAMSSGQFWRAYCQGHCCAISIASNVFHAWISDKLILNLSPVVVLVMENANFHKRCDTQQVISAAGHILE